MAYINVTNIQLLNNPASFTSPLTFQITFECLKELPEEVEWKLLYIGSSKDVKYDQMLDTFSMGPLEYGSMQFDLESNPPDPSNIPQNEILGATAIILSVAYRNQEFFRVGYYVYNYYTDPELSDNPPEQVLIDKVCRNVLADKPRITRFEIKWGDEKEEEITEGQEVNMESEEAKREKMHLFMNPEDNPFNAASASHSLNPFLTGNEVSQHSQSFAHENTGFGAFSGEQGGMVEENPNKNPFM